MSSAYVSSHPGPLPPSTHQGSGSAQASSAVTLDGLTKRYGRRLAVDGLTLSIPRGVTAGLIGPNGAGKTTTLAMLLGLVRPTAGSGSVLGQPLTSPQGYLHRVGALLETPAFYRSLSGHDNLAVLAAAGGHDPAQIAGLLDLVGLQERGGDLFRSYSMGMKQRLGIAAALLGDPDLLVLDEPTNGLDPAGIREVRELVARLSSSGRTVLISSHVLAELQHVSNWLVIVDHGRLLYEGPASDFLDRAESRLIVAAGAPAELGRLRSILESNGFGTKLEGEAIAFPVAPERIRAAGAEVNRIAAAHGITLAEIQPVRTTLEDRYLALTSGGE